MNESETQKEQPTPKWNLLTNPEEILEKYGFEYFQATLNFQNFVEKFVQQTDLPNPANFEDMATFLNQIAQQVGKILPFYKRGNGQDTVVNQSILIGSDMEQVSSDMKTLYKEKTDCKLPTAALAFLLNWYFFTKNWPLEAALFTDSTKFHVAVAVKIKDEISNSEKEKLKNLPKCNPKDYIFLDYQPIENYFPLSKPFLHNIDTAKKLVKRGTWAISTNLTEGLQKIDERYLDSLDN